jgi:hypothetical protein
MTKFLTILLLISAVIVGSSLSGKNSEAARLADKLSVDEIISKHLESIGPASARAAAGGRIVGGTTQVTFRSRGIAQGDGGAVLASDGPKSMVTMKFESSQYPYEKIGFDGTRVTAYQLHPGDYSSLGSFARVTPEMFKEGLLGGTLSSAWTFLDLSNKKIKMELGGTRKINDRPAYEVKYLVHGGSDLRITLFFDAETFQHVRTVYKKELPAQMSRNIPGSTQRSAGGTSATGGGRSSGSPGTSDRVGEGSAQQSNTTYELTEEFSDFRTEGGLTLPHTYKLHLVQLGSATQISDWVMTLVKFAFNQHLEAGDFDVSSE